jgi:hypothetical protein
MNFSSIEETYSNPDPTSALILEIWFTFIGLLGIPPNIFIVVATLLNKEIRAIPSNTFIASLAFADAFFLLFFALHLLYALIPSDVTCKVLGGGLALFALGNICIPPLLAINRYAIVCSQKEQLAKFLLVAFSRKGITL